MWEKSYAELLDDVGDAEEGRLLEGEHGVLAVERRKLAAVGVEGLVVVLGELLWTVFSYILSKR